MLYINRTVPAVLSASLLFVGPTACSNGAVEPTWLTEVDGTWEWAYSVERSAEGEVLSPVSEGFTAQLRLIADGSEGTFEYTRDGEVFASGRFVIGYEDAPGNDFIVWDPAFASFHDQQWLTLMVGDSLRLTDATIGGYESTWTRAR